ncbi:hypothetical protein Pyn_09881 [Prunus yedoensis var. nudiflora]|uniref:SH3 domain-containing protein n=1 Tax=Prunus yedoensis var. nudiflora TaxID=2094558 RepID=A0A314UJL2_PRUYE|nr:hypothetical protein Pyn_09881 [Prunus yedoensis var. nudiflora]
MCPWTFDYGIWLKLRGLEETDIPIHLRGGPSFSEGLGSPIREEPPPYSSPATQRFESFDNPLAGRGSQSFESQDDERISFGNPQHGTALYDFTAGGDDELNLTAGEDVEIEYEEDGWFDASV